MILAINVSVVPFSIDVASGIRLGNLFVSSFPGKLIRCGNDSCVPRQIQAYG